MRIRLDIEVEDSQVRKIVAYHAHGAYKDNPKKRQRAILKSFIEEKLAYAYEAEADPLDESA
jgi:hypothetical protein